MGGEMGMIENCKDEDPSLTKENVDILQVVEKYRKLKDKGVKVSAIWIQDWSGKIVTSLGKRVFWNWQLDEQFYWKKDEMKAKLRVKRIQQH